MGLLLMASPPLANEPPDDAGEDGHLAGCCIVIPSSPDEMAKSETGERIGDDGGDGLRRDRAALIACLVVPLPDEAATVETGERMGGDGRRRRAMALGWLVASSSEEDKTSMTDAGTDRSGMVLPPCCVRREEEKLGGIVGAMTVDGCDAGGLDGFGDALVALFIDSIINSSR